MLPAPLPPSPTPMIMRQFWTYVPNFVRIGLSLSEKSNQNERHGRTNWPTNPNKHTRSQYLLAAVILENIGDVILPPAHRYIVVIIFVNNSFIDIRQGSPLLHDRTSEMFNHQPRTPIAIFELGFLFVHRMIPWKFRDDISNGSGVIALTSTGLTHKRTKRALRAPSSKGAPSKTGRKFI